MDKSVYAADCIETPHDITALEQVLARHVSSTGSSPKFTANFVMANPDFETIEGSGFQSYHYTPYFEEQSLFDGPALAAAWSGAIGRGSFGPQLHCREHVKWWTWMEDLRRKGTDATATFDLRMCGVPRVCSGTQTSYFQPIYVEDNYIRSNPQAMADTVLEGAGLFEAHFGRKSETTIAPVAFWNDGIEALWNEAAIKGIQSPWLQSLKTDDKLSHIPRYLGQTNRHGQTYLLRNCTFEPRKRSLGFDRCFADVSRAFRFRKPAVISTHRVNYVGSVEPSGAAQAREELDRLIQSILTRWPETEFLTSDELYRKVINDT